MRPGGVDDIGRGIALACGAVLLFSTMNILVRWQAARYPIIELVFFRSLFALAPVVAMAAWGGGLGSLRTSVPLAHLWRSLLWFASVFCNFNAFFLLPMADAVAISFSAPLLVVALSAPILGERVGRHRWAAVLAGFVGVLVMTRPGSAALDWGALFALGNAVFSALGGLTLRKMSATEPSVTIVFYTMLLATVLAGLALPFIWVAPSPGDLALLALLGLMGGVAQLMMVQAFHHAPASAVSPWNYTAMLWGLLYGFFFFAELPDAPVLAGAAIVIVSGLYLLRAERRQR